MNIGAIESAFSRALEFTVPTLTVLKATDDATVPPDHSYVLVDVERCENLVGNLWKATVVASVLTPAPLYSESDHNEVVRAVMALFTQEGQQTLYDRYTSYSTPLGHTCGGGKLLYADADPDGNNYRHNVAILLGLVAS